MRHWAEEEAKRHLQALGYRVLAENFATRGGEIDLVVEQAGTVVFVEVRQRSSTRFGTAGETIDSRKLGRLRRTAAHFLLQRFGAEQVPTRFDAVLVHGRRGSHRLEHLVAIA